MKHNNAILKYNGKYIKTEGYIPNQKIQISGGNLRQMEDAREKATAD